MSRLGRFASTGKVRSRRMIKSAAAAVESLEGRTLPSLQGRFRR